MVHKHGLHTDEALSYVVATGHLRAFETGAGEPRGRWVPAAQWQALWHPQALLDFRQIARDLGEYGIHPALYFLLLHAWVSVLAFWSGPLLDLFIDVATGLLCSAWRGACSTTRCRPRWSHCLGRESGRPATSSMARMYPLLALFAVLLSGCSIVSIVATVTAPPPARPLLLTLAHRRRHAHPVSVRADRRRGSYFWWWRRFLRLDRRRCLQALSRDDRRPDRHPSLRSPASTDQSLGGDKGRPARTRCSRRRPFLTRLLDAAAATLRLLRARSGLVQAPDHARCPAGQSRPGHRRPSALALFGFWLVVGPCRGPACSGVQAMARTHRQDGLDRPRACRLDRRHDPAAGLTFLSQPRGCPHVIWPWPAAFFSLSPAGGSCLTPRAANAIVTGFCLVVLVA